MPKPELGGPADEVVPLDVRDVDVEPEPVGQRAHGGGQPGRIEPAGVGDDLHAAVQRRPRHSSSWVRNVLA